MSFESCFNSLFVGKNRKAMSSLQSLVLWRPHKALSNQMIRESQIKKVNFNWFWALYLGRFELIINLKGKLANKCYTDFFPSIFMFTNRNISSWITLDLVLLKFRMRISSMINFLDKTQFSHESEYCFTLSKLVLAWASTLYGTGLL